MKIGFIGCGNMASAIIKGIINAGVVEATDIFAYEPNESKITEMVKNYGINKLGSEKEIAENTDCIVLAVKPNTISNVLDKIDLSINSNKLLVSIAAGKTLEFLRSCLSHDAKIIRVMPNINAKVSCACCAYCANSLVEESDKKIIEELFSAVGSITELSENFFPQFGVISGCSPAFVYMFIDALARAGVQNGLPKELALKFAAQSVSGSAKMILESGEHPYELIDKVCSPGGTTIEGVISLQKDGFEAAVHNAVNKAVEKDKKL